MKKTLPILVSYMTILFAPFTQAQTTAPTLATKALMERAFGGDSNAQFLLA